MPECRNSLLCADDGKVVVISRANSRLDVRMHLQHFAALGHLPNHAPMSHAKCPVIYSSHRQGHHAMPCTCDHDIEPMGLIFKHGQQLTVDSLGKGRGEVKIRQVGQTADVISRVQVFPRTCRAVK